MKVRCQYELPQDKQKLLKKAKTLEWWTIFFLLTITVVMYFALGSSQAMKTAWIEDVLSMIPPIVFLIAMHFSGKPPTEQFPYGHHRTMMLSFMVAAVAVLVVGLYLLYGAIATLLKGHHPTLNHISLFGWYVWSGWVMIAALIYSVIPPFILGRMKLPLAKDLHEKTLHADAAMNKADWMTGGAAVLGILGIGLGWWWADAAAAAFISLSVIKDGFTNTKRAMVDLMDSRPTDAASDKPLDLAQRIREKLLGFPDVEDAAARLREDGHVISGEVFVVLNTDKPIAARLETLAEQATAIDWRLYSLTIMPVESIER
ncbi:MAG TPA: cation diffusion facilitator family transporter [Gammaproteobacteria bacterium]|nr:cation diffusion facilitator family transporter [Gammaproteobacteria bacterium]